MIVVDASVVANVVGDDGADGAAARAAVREAGALAAPDLLDVEVLSVLRRRWRAGTLTLPRFRAAVDDLVDLPVHRHAMRPLIGRAFDLRANVSPHDAVYVALAEGLACPLATADVRLSKAPGPSCEVRVLPS